MSRKTVSRSVLFSALTATTLLAAPQADAAGRWPNWYVGLHGALDYVSESSVKDNAVIDSVTSDTGFGFGAAVGYRPASDNQILRNLRFEAEWHQQQNDLDEADSIFGGVPSDGTTKVSAFMANVYYDFAMMDQFHQPRPLVPYVGAGLGVASFTMDDAGLTFGNINNSDDVMAWQLMAGLSYSPAFMPFTEWTVGYRFFNTTNPSFTYLDGTTFETEYTSHNAEVGVRFLF